MTAAVRRSLPSAAAEHCRWCGGGHAIEFCGQVLAACGVTDADRRDADALLRSGALPVYAKMALGCEPRKPGPKGGMGDSNKGARHDSYPCVVYGCETPRATGRPRCPRHEAEALRERRAKWAERQGY